MFKRIFIRLILSFHKAVNISYFGVFFLSHSLHSNCIDGNSQFKNDLNTRYTNDPGEMFGLIGKSLKYDLKYYHTKMVYNL